ncbi:hypothetical protein MXD61_08690 [Frankia sp. AgPm24]|uniref:hypothetical protein n=1 Tax=Frankia sp. AgPm24 TaxID=631128 RepID=UPI00200FAD73|nr:hypothetical protein [Frankia sp. AgPm24]MCK9921960.1 hypothetical protein [Frankia sp. AgPm24]
MRIKALFSSFFVAFAVLAGTLLVPAGTANAATTLSCRALALVPNPTMNQTEPVLIETASSARVTGLAHYRTTTTRKSGTADTLGRAVLRWRISHATPGYRVLITITVSSGSQRATCTTSFTPASRG